MTIETDSDKDALPCQVYSSSGILVCKYVESPDIENSIFHVVEQKTGRGIESIMKQTALYIQNNKTLLRCDYLDEFHAGNSYLNEVDYYNATAVSNLCNASLIIYDKNGTIRAQIEPFCDKRDETIKIQMCYLEDNDYTERRRFNTIIRFYTTTCSTSTTVGTAPTSHQMSIPRICSWNIRGCCSKSKRDIIDEELTKRDIHVACLQEVTVEASQLSTENYVWYISKHSRNKSRGLAFLVRKGTRIVVQNVRYEFENIQGVEIILPVRGKMTKLQVINLHATSSGYAKFLGDLGSYIGTIKNGKDLICLGDTNAQIGIFFCKVIYLV